ncbi:potassium channel family protein [Saccharopolyspora erythraea]|uniref:Potassium uptake protein n=1 Tax=Saccharopolyspora erythraea (strain ATCC 11635 / DSM 40517 / JCM 4748 / NBRC 13426 / NCIMB 8594 / NRRL 2338) TaxID=405948 RepID=A4FBN2_SACEN|nr:TrkA family potassium uptake protein [Saccharopolyspora erythraea]EQD87501.1 potassium transporter [Saccharopolyspora erythraea D]QRK93462.1 TrkA family potassium uptake protein [Saccharopolyspora erythraea]CAM01457.1 potassium uptake protein [Saccharopolyspora erythraea NRRL 2338]
MVIGLGRFGSSLAGELVSRGSEVLAIDSRPDVVQRHADELTHTAVADTTDPESLRQLGVPQFRRAVVAIGTDLEASILTTSLLADFGIPHIWAKATSRQHGRILERVGAHHVVLPEHDMGERVAHLVTGRMLDYIEIEEDFALVKTLTPDEAVDRALGESRLRSKYGVTVVGVKRPGEEFTYATADTVVRKGDILIVAGQKDQVEEFADIT